MLGEDPIDDDLLDDAPEEVEAYCMRCRQVVEMEHPTPVWTRRGTPGTRGECAICGTTLFRMGRTEAHRGLKSPEIRTMVGEETTARRTRVGIPRLAAFINYAVTDTELARRIADDLAKSGIPAWIDDNPGLPDSQWASGVQPGLVECSHMIVVLSTLAAQSPDVQKNWVTFKGLRKPILVAVVEECPVPDELRRSPRFAIGAEYRTALRQMVQALAG